jgi:hypothetical protein
MMKRTAGIFASVLVAGIAVNAQDGTFRAYDFEQAMGPGALAGVLRQGVDVISVDPLSIGRPVLNAPYSAEAVTEVTQTLADGNRIEQRTSAIIARDAKGRTRREQHGIPIGRFVAQSDQPIVTITDPSTGLHITLNYQDKIAFRVKPARGKLDDAMVTGSGPVAFGIAIPPMVSMTMGAPSASASRSDAVPTPPEAGARVFSADPFEAPVFERAVPPPARDGRPPFAARSEGTVNTESLEPRVIEGVKAEGIRTTVTIPAGTMGNALPMEIVSERWYSPELGIVLLTRRSDPRFGETVYRVTNIDRSEPPSDLFQVPSDFQIKDVPVGKATPVKP